MDNSSIQQEKESNNTDLQKVVTSSDSSNKWNISKRNILLILVSVFALLFLTVVGYFYFQNQKLQQSINREPSSTNINPPPVSGSPDETASWKTYINEKHGFSIRYPGNWQADSAEVWSGVIDASSTSDFINLHPVGNDSTPYIKIDPRQALSDKSFDSNSMLVLNQNQATDIKSSQSIIGDVKVRAWEGIMHKGTNVFFNRTYNLPSLRVTYGDNKDKTNFKIVEQILSTLTLVSPTVQKLTFSNGSTIDFKLGNTNASVKKLNTDSYNVSLSSEIGIKFTFYQLLPKTVIEDFFKDSDGNEAGTGCHFDKSETLLVNNYNFNKRICYYNPINLTKSGKYDPKISSMISMSCIYSYPNKKGYIVFEPLSPTPVGTDVCQIIGGLSSLKIN